MDNPLDQILDTIYAFTAISCLEVGVEPPKPFKAPTEPCAAFEDTQEEGS